MSGFEQHRNRGNDPGDAPGDPVPLSGFFIRVLTLFSRRSGNVTAPMFFLGGLFVYLCFANSELYINFPEIPPSTPTSSDEPDASCGAETSRGYSSKWLSFFSLAWDFFFFFTLVLSGNYTFLVSEATWTGAWQRHKELIIIPPPGSAVNPLCS